MSNRGKIYKLRKQIRGKYDEEAKARIVEIDTLIIKHKVRDFLLFEKIVILLSEFSKDFNASKVLGIIANMGSACYPTREELVLYRKLLSAIIIKTSAKFLRYTLHL